MAFLEIAKDSNMVQLLSAQARGERVESDKAAELDKEVVR